MNPTAGAARSGLDHDPLHHGYVESHVRGARFHNFPGSDGNGGVLWGWVLSTVILAMAALLVNNRELWFGFVIVAAVPPAVAVIPFADFLKGDRVYALFGTTGVYLAGLLLMPLMALLFLETDIAEPLSIVMIILELIVGPFVVSRLFIRARLEKEIDPTKAP